MLKLFRTIASKITKDTPIHTTYVLVMTLALLFWLMQGSISAYWSLTYHRPSPLESLSRFEWWKKGKVIYKYINTFNDKDRDNQYDDDSNNQDDEPINAEIVTFIEPIKNTQTNNKVNTQEKITVKNQVIKESNTTSKAIAPAKKETSTQKYHADIEPLDSLEKITNPPQKKDHSVLVENNQTSSEIPIKKTLIKTQASKKINTISKSITSVKAKKETNTKVHHADAKPLYPSEETKNLPQEKKHSVLVENNQVPTDAPAMSNRGLQLFTPKNEADISLKSSTSDIKEKIIKSKSPESIESIKLPEPNKKVTQNTKQVTTITQKKPLKGKSPNKQKPTIASSEKTKITHHLTRDVSRNITRNIKSIKTVNMGNKSGITLYSNDKVFFVGDSLMQGIAPHIKYKLSKKYGIKAINKSKQSTGLSYHKFLNWPKTVNQTLKANKTIRLMIVFLGPNDPWSMPSRKGGKFLKFKTKKWESVYRSRIKTIIKMAKKRHVQILWLGVPNMRRNKLNRGVDYLNTLYRSEAKKAGIIYVPTNPLFGYKGKVYNKFGPNLKGKTVSLRTKDGIHFTASGQKRIANYVLSLIKIKSGTRP